MSLKADILIIGGGIAGLSIARELSKYELDVVVVEKEADVGWGQTKVSYAIRHPGVRWSPGTLARELIMESNLALDQLIQELDIDFNECGELILAFNSEELESLKILKDRGAEMHVKGIEMIDRSEVRRLEPRVNPAAVAALRLPTAGIFNPFDLAHAFFENARDNGVRMLMNTEVIWIAHDKGGFIIETDQGDIRAARIINAAGLHAQRVALMAGADNFKIDYSTKSTCFVLDQSLVHLVHHIVTGLTDLEAFTRFKAVMPTYGGNILIYTPIAEPAAGIHDTAVEERTLRLTCESARTLIPDVNFERHIISFFSGLTARNDRGDFIIEASEKYDGFVNVALPPPGITCSPAIGKRVVEILKKNDGFTLKEKSDFTPRRRRQGPIRDKSAEEVDDLVKRDSRYGRLVCRCETVTAGEIKDAVNRGASTLDGIKFRTRAGMGRCQGNFCSPQVADILARETDQPVQKITKKGPGSELLDGEVAD